MNSSRQILAGGIIGLAFLIAFGLFLSDVELDLDLDEVKPAAKVKPIIYDDDYIVEKFVTGLEYPLTMTFVGEDMLVLEKNTGKVIRIQDNGIVSDLVLDLPVSSAIEAGLLGITSVSNHVYLYFTESLSGSDEYNSEDVITFFILLDMNGEKLTNPILIKELPRNLAQFHHGGAMTKGLNNEVYLYINSAWGDQHQRAVFQNIPVKTILETGSIFKIDTESNNSIELFAMGIRNSFGLAVDPVTGYLWDTESGVNSYDEINLVRPGFNSGWISVMGPVDRDNTDTGLDVEVYLTQTIPPPFENFVYSDPEFSWHNAVTPTALAFPNFSSGKYSDSLFVGDFNNGRIYKFQLNTDRTEFVFSDPGLSDLVLDDGDEIEEILFGKGFQGITDIEFHDGAMYVVSIGDGSIYKIYRKNILPPLKQYQNDVTHKNIVCMPSLMPIMSKSGYIYCAQPKTAITLIQVGWSITHPEMPKIELKNQDLQGLNFEYANLSNSDFTGSNFDNAKISNVDFTRANLSHTDLSGRDLTGTILTGADLSQTNLTGVDLSGMDLSQANLTGVDLSGMDLTGTILTGADLSQTNLTGVDLSGKDLTGTILRGADLSQTNLTNVNLSGRDLTGTILTGVDLSGKDLSNAILINANLENATLENAKLLDVNLDGANLTNADLRNILLVDANLSNAILVGADLTNAVLTGAILTGANLENAVLTNAILNCIGHPICI